MTVTHALGSADRLIGKHVCLQGQAMMSGWRVVVADPATRTERFSSSNVILIKAPGLGVELRLTGLVTLGGLVGVAKNFRLCGRLDHSSVAPYVLQLCDVSNASLYNPYEEREVVIDVLDMDRPREHEVAAVLRDQDATVVEKERYIAEIAERRSSW